MPSNEPGDGAEDRWTPAEAEMGDGTSGGAEAGIEDEQVTIKTLLGTVVEKAGLLARRPLMRKPLRVLTKPRLTLYEVPERLTPIYLRVGRVGIRSRHRGVAEVDADVGEGWKSSTDGKDPLVDLLAEVRALRAMIAAAFRAGPPGGVCMGGPPGRCAVGG